MTPIHENIKRARMMAGYPRQADLTGELGLALNQLSRWESGRVRPTRGELSTLSKALGVTEHFLRFGYDKPQGIWHVESRATTSISSVQSRDTR